MIEAGASTARARARGCARPVVPLCALTALVAALAAPGGLSWATEPGPAGSGPTGSGPTGSGPNGPGAGALEVTTLGANRQVNLRADDAPLASALEHLAGLDGREVKVADDIRDRLSGRLTGTAEELIELLLDTHDLGAHADADTIWFDRIGRRVVDFVPLEPERVKVALDALARPLGVGGVALRDASGKGIVLSGTRAYVATSLERVRLALEAIDNATAVPRAVVDEPAAASPVVARGEREPGAASLVRVGDDRPVTRRLALGEPEAAEHFGGRVALVSSRMPRKVGLDDGTWLALGDVLSNGHRLVAIESERLVTERDEERTVVAMPPAE